MLRHGPNRVFLDTFPFLLSFCVWLFWNLVTKIFPRIVHCEGFSPMDSCLLYYCGGIVSREGVATVIDTTDRCVSHERSEGPGKVEEDASITRLKTWAEHQVRFSLKLLEHGTHAVTLRFYPANVRTFCMLGLVRNTAERGDVQG
ncbi:hypothetical protein L873DRAFT_247015 [Choiromyces venosus 120613-1]|uniref:Uncharacterized protein n=1 Tax=Choiromyces venosus 120613-1 TaxID=1336337 RepID=A0A3N4J1M8_9PEZI|nr:hypothetical protein L873DRAFT_247015 [Choiromyces venosus 120613-1]